MFGELWSTSFEVRSAALQVIGSTRFNPEFGQKHGKKLCGLATVPKDGPSTRASWCVHAKAKWAALEAKHIIQGCQRVKNVLKCTAILSTIICNDFVVPKTSWQQDIMQVSVKGACIFVFQTCPVARISVVERDNSHGQPLILKRRMW